MNSKMNSSWENGRNSAAVDVAGFPGLKLEKLNDTYKRCLILKRQNLPTNSD